MRTALAIAVAVLALWGLTRLMEGRLSYFPVREVGADPAIYGLRCADIFFTTADGVRLHGWYCLPGEGTEHRADVIFFHGNAGNVSHRLGKIRELAGLGLGVFIFDYRGFGRSGGSSGDAGLLEDARAAFRVFRERMAAPRRPLGIYGESIGCLLAVRQAALNRDAAFLVLEGAFPGKRAVVARTPVLWPFIPFVSATLDMGAHAARIGLPVLVMHAREDEVIPVALGRAVHERLTQSALREWYEVPRGGHNDCSEEDSSFFPRIDAFLGRALPRAAAVRLVK
jgi:fermentation-respiration switch protein FrsA (DUF1100 family)